MRRRRMMVVAKGAKRTLTAPHSQCWIHEYTPQFVLPRLARRPTAVCDLQRGQSLWNTDCADDTRPRSASFVAQVATFNMLTLDSAGSV